MTSTARALFLAGTIASIAAMGCNGGGPADASMSPAECTAITERCHPVDPGTGPIHACHEMAEDPSATAASCMAMQAMCFAVCVPPADAGSDGGSGNDASTMDGGGGD